MRIRILNFYLIRIRIRLFTLMRIWILASKKGSNAGKTAKIGSYSTFWLDIYKLMRIRIRFRIQFINLDADTNPDFYLMRIRLRIQVTKMMRKLADPDPQHCIIVLTPLFFSAFL
jgi:hypothetical protein